MWILAAVLTAALAGGCGGGKNPASDTKNLVIVNGQSISMADYYEYLEVKGSVLVSAQGQRITLPVAETLGFQALQDLVQRQLLLQMATDEGVAPTEKDVLDEIEFKKKINPNIVRELQARGMTLSQIKDTIMADLAQERLLTKGITVTDAEVQQFIKDNPKQFTDPERYDMQWILVKDDSIKAKIDQEIRAGTNFGQLAIQYSLDPQAKQSTGRFPNGVIETLPEPVRKVVVAAPEGGTSEWVRTEAGSAKFYIEKKNPAKPVVMDEAKTTLLKRQLAMQRGAKALDLSKRLADKLKEAKVEIKYSDLKSPWEKLMERVKDAAATANTPGTMPTPTTTGGVPETPGATTTGGTTPEGTTGK